MPPIPIILFCYRTGEKVEVELVFRSKMRTSEDRHAACTNFQAFALYMTNGNLNCHISLNHVATGNIVPFPIAENMARSHRRK
ncbi:hypothetical protein PAHAL_2G355400 [Panicum hallii]|uniref:Uncharacterized protein n=1 Tax=Panicum hallii TaxID=206008 RepID=A0A2T8KRG4_9POAL|nr:hypothetical protein PAHAL_2G355400 [Panicum hallii]